MPICFVPSREGDKDDAHVPGVSLTHRDMAHRDPAHQEWREPPGYLGEAVRRAKRIASLSQPAEPSKPRDC
ncbi:MAG TPA: hypothetical protein VN175_05740 [Rhizomicrobium sp.]|nr:hypothetical protein [Rhizomicrobium sp.]